MNPSMYHLKEKQEEVAVGRLVPVQASNVVQISPIGIIPKSSQPGKFRLIVDLSAPQGACVNEGITSELCSLLNKTELVCIK